MRSPPQLIFLKTISGKRKHVQMYCDMCLWRPLPLGSMTLFCSPTCALRRAQLLESATPAPRCFICRRRTRHYKICSKQCALNLERFGDAIVDEEAVREMHGLNQWEVAQVVRRIRIEVRRELRLNRRRR